MSKGKVRVPTAPAPVVDSVKTLLEDPTEVEQAQEYAGEQTGHETGHTKDSDE